MTDGDIGARATIRTVAADAGVSVAAVSKVMRNAYGVSDALRQKVEASIGKLGYRPSVAARGMRGRTFTLGVLLVGLDNSFLNMIYQGIETIAAAEGYKIMVGIGAAQTPTEVQLIEQMIDNRMDGLILVGAKISGETLEHYARQIPIVVIGHHEPSGVGYDTINNNDQGGAAMVVQAFVDRGYRDIAYLTQEDQEDRSADVAPQRELGYCRAMAAAGLDVHTRVLRLPRFITARDNVIQKILTASDRPRAIFCWSDLDAVPLLGGALRLGIRVPQDLAVVGFDNSAVAALPMVDLTSVDQDGPRLGRLSAEALFSRMAGRKVAEHVQIEPVLFKRSTL